MSGPAFLRASSFRYHASVLALVVGVLAACHDTAPPIIAPADLDVGEPEDTTETPDGGEDTLLPDTADTADTGSPPVELCTIDGGFGCPCSTQSDCLDGLCIEGPDGNVCSRTCITECPEGFDCMTTSIGGPDPVAICVPRHTRLCRPCRGAFDCQNPLDPLPAACVPATNPAEGSFCATSCAQTDCPDGFSCEDVDSGDGVPSRLCVPTDGLCDCRPSWDGLGFVTACSLDEAGQGCGGTRTCGPEGLTACAEEAADTEVCNGLDDDCNGTTDDIAGVECENGNDYGTCTGRTTCVNAQEVCGAQQPSPEICNNIDDNCADGIDESWTNCPLATCQTANGAFFETGASTCQAGVCVFGSPRPCGLFTCDGGGDSGDACATSCTNDSMCIETAHCDLATNTCVNDRPNGSACEEGRQCGSGICNNGFCCNGGDCCGQASDCPPNWWTEPVCDDGTTCQGTRLDARCVESTCTFSSPIDDDSGCNQDQLAVDCSPLRPRYCTGAPNQMAPECPATCSSDADCVPGFWCDGVCVPKQPNGEVCTGANQCQSGWCENGFCCNDGDCCRTANDCPSEWRTPPTCLDAFSCQGERVDALCIGNQCGSQVVLDDSGCDTNTEANDCGPYSAVFCSGATTQQPPRCQFACTSDAQCDAGFWCNGTCTPKLPDGSFCNGNNACSSNYCNNNICCSGGSCCNFPSDCPSSFSTEPVCNTSLTCQGTRTAATCVNKVCGSQTAVADDSGCTSSVVASQCGPYPAVRCNGQTSQNAPNCANSCTSNSDCDSDAFCRNNQCIPKLIDGSQCTDRSQCASNHCQNGFCCANGDCCATAANCSASLYGSESTCQDAASCQGDKLVPACTNSICAVGARVADDSGCNTRESNACGYYTSVFCNANVTQSAPSCPTSCTNNNQCDPGANCTNGQCVPNAGAGGACTTSSQCDSGLTCVDGVCCTSTCTGLCQACNLSGSQGICRPIASGNDPGGECGQVACTGYYFGFEGSTCFAMAAVSANTTSCNGASACESAADVCPTSSKGTSVSSCHATCQTPTPGTCSGTTPPQCTNITGGTQTCGVGACQRTVDRCESGAPKTCVPGQPSAEVCDGIDNDCDGLTDAADPNLVLVACNNQNGVCSGSMRPASLCVAGRWNSCTNTQYTAHSTFFQAGTETSCDGRDNDCDASTDEDFTYTSPAGTQVVGAGKACGTGACFGGTTQCGLGNTLLCSTDNRIATETCDGSDNDCDGVTDSLDASLQLISCQNQSGVCSGSMRPASLCASGTWQNCTATQFAAHSTFYESTEVSCDGRDNNCNGQIDDNLTAPLNDNQLGVCSGSRKSCGGLAGWQNNYVNVPNYNASESAPDANYRDENCDGIDGNTLQGIFVSTAGTDASTCGLTPETACRTVQYAVDNRVNTTRKYVYVRTGTYGSTTGTALNITKSVEIFGGYNASWVRAARTTSGHLVVLTGRDFTEGSDLQYMAVRVVGAGAASTTVRLADLRIEAVSPPSTARESDGTGKSSYAVYGRSATLFVDRSEIVQGNGATGAAGGAGTSASQTAAPTGTRGTNAERVCSSCSTYQIPGGAGASSSCDATATRGGNGGNGGRYDTSCGSCGCSLCGNCDAQWGVAGSSANVTSGSLGTGGRAGGLCNSTTTPGVGISGNSSHGTGGDGATGSVGRVVSNFWRGFVGSTGSLGAHGGGGGGGGGAGACDDGCDERGASGGGGGAGGCLATVGGSGGAPGGGSFGIFMVSATLTVSNTIFQRGLGGVGGAGGAGGLGQPGGAGGGGGTKDTNTNNAGAGGSGGLGGHSGGGGGGGGGSVFGVFTLSSTVNASTGNTFNGGAAGTGGAGGTGGPPANPITSVTGKTGVDGTLGTTRACSAAGGC
jgi:hypothetical protein